ncbi:hypothetical protein ALT761_02696 [Alteromonas sp. 76-1]|nr:hypothetical protein ALT761_02696 [Alteromonas sp. 76-1]
MFAHRVNALEWLLYRLSEPSHNLSNTSTSTSMKTVM